MGAVSNNTSFSSGVRIRGQKSSMGGPQGREESFPFFFFFPSPQTSSKEYAAFSRQNVTVCF